MSLPAADLSLGSARASRVGDDVLAIVDILRLVVDQGMRLVLFGLVVGLVAALALGRLLTSQLYQVSASNPLLLGGTMSILALAALLACLFPARRASLVNPVEALRAD